MGGVVPRRPTGQCADAVVVLPGIMGSELVEAATGKPLWGLANAGWYREAWFSGASLEALEVRPEERAGRTGRVVATRLLEFPAFAPLLRGFEPYTALTESVRATATHPDAVLAYPYDWRLAVAHNASQLAAAADDHLRQWRRHPHGSTTARLVLVAHSMGGLVARYFTEILGGSAEVRATVTLGTPLRGSAKALQILGSGRGAPLPLPLRRLRRLVSGMPGLHDLLPSYRCVADGAVARRITAGEVAALGGDAELAGSAAALHERLEAAQPAGLRAVVGVWQPTVQTVELTDGAVEPQRWSYAEGQEGVTDDRGGDGTVPRDAAADGTDPIYFAQTHGALPRMPEALDQVRGVLTEDPRGTWLGEPPPLSVETPDIAPAGRPFTVDVSGVADPAAVTCRITDAASGLAVAHPRILPQTDGLRATVTLAAGLYRVAVKGESFSPITELVLVS
jgi:hypothetical protein